MRHGVPVSDALRNDRPSHVPAYFWAGPAAAEVRDLSPGAHEAKTTEAQSSVRMCCLRYVSRMEYERSDGLTQGSGVEPGTRVGKSRQLETLRPDVLVPEPRPVRDELLHQANTLRILQHSDGHAT